MSISTTATFLAKPYVRFCVSLTYLIIVLFFSLWNLRLCVKISSMQQSSTSSIAMGLTEP